MTNATERLRRYLDDEIGACTDGDLSERLTEIERLKTENGDVVVEDVQVFSALSSDTRYRLVRALVDANDELCVCELGPLVDVSESAISHALTKLVDAGLLSRRKEGRWRMYRATQRATSLLAAIDGTRRSERR